MEVHRALPDVLVAPRGRLDGGVLGRGDDRITGLDPSFVGVRGVDPQGSVRVPVSVASLALPPVTGRSPSSAGDPNPTTDRGDPNGVRPSGVSNESR